MLDVWTRRGLSGSTRGRENLESFWVEELWPQALSLRRVLWGLLSNVEVRVKRRVLTISARIVPHLINETLSRFVVVIQRFLNTIHS